MSRPPAFLSENFAGRSNISLSAFAKPTTAKYVTRPLSNLRITVVKQLESVLLNDSPAAASAVETAVTLAGYGKVNVKRRVHGYKKLSLITRQELSRSELGEFLIVSLENFNAVLLMCNFSALPPLEYDTFGCFICADSAGLTSELGEFRFGEGVHALSHAILAVAPLLAHGLQRDDLECDHSYFAPTQVVLLDERAGGSGCVERLWQTFFQPNNNIIEEAVKLLEQCSYCSSDTSSSYDGGCPGCIHAHNCLQFNMHLSRSAAIVVGKRMLERIKRTDLYQMNAAANVATTAASDAGGAATTCSSSAMDTTPRRLARQKKLRRAKEIPRTMYGSYVVGRTSWPTDTEKGVGQQEYE
jgi:DEAD/DEAH box helicase domain-containing protein